MSFGEYFSNLSVVDHFLPVQPHRSGRSRKLIRLICAFLLQIVRVFQIASFGSEGRRGSTRHSISFELLGNFGFKETSGTKEGGVVLYIF